jgi:uncharacterized NAD(P)/FAD-binding protein YdhS
LPNPTSSEIVIVGGGLSGTLVAAELLRRGRAPLRVFLVERSNTIGAGLAYGTSCPDHFLNVRASGMSAVAGHPDHLLEWLRGSGAESARRWGADAAATSFLPRGLYAEYARGVLDAAASAAPSGVRLERIRGEALEVETGRLGAAERASRAVRPAGWVTLDDGRRLPAEHVILAVGNPPPRHPSDAPSPAYSTSRYVRNPWAEEALRGIDPNAAVLIAGTNLTMVDVVVALARAGHVGILHAVSRHGLIPREHGPAAPVRGSETVMTSLNGDSAASAGRGKEPLLPSRVREALRALRVEAARGSPMGGEAPGVPEAGGWRAAIDALRPQTQRLWMGFSEEERSRFLRHARPYWEVHRHRGVPANLRDLRALSAKGRLIVRAARIVALEERGPGLAVSLAPRGSATIETLEVARLINATGPEGDFVRAGIPVVDRLFRDGLARPGPLSLGLDATPQGALRDASGTASTFLSTLGPPLRGVLWETTAVPEIREQAARLAARLLD